MAEQHCRPRRPSWIWASILRRLLAVLTRLITHPVVAALAAVIAGGCDTGRPGRPATGPTGRARGPPAQTGIAPARITRRDATNHHDHQRTQRKERAHPRADMSRPARLPAASAASTRNSTKDTNERKTQTRDPNLNEG
jgi:hypothetical protein